MQNILNDAIDIIIKNFAPDKIILFGSRATGMAGKDSDYDLCILKSDLQHKRKAAQDIYKALIGLQIPVDVIVETPIYTKRIFLKPSVDVTWKSLCQPMVFIYFSELGKKRVSFILRTLV